MDRIKQDLYSDNILFNPVHKICPTPDEWQMRYFCTRIVDFYKWRNVLVTGKHGGDSSGSMP